MKTIDRRAYAEMYGPTTGDRVRLGDTDLVIEVERDHTIYGEEVKFGGGKVIRDGMGQSQRAGDDGGRHGDHQRGRLRRRRRSSRPTSASSTGASPASARPATPTCSRASTSSSARAPRSSPAKADLLTAGGIDTHIHFICPQQVDDALMSGVTTMIGGGTGPAAGTNATTCTPGAWNVARMLQAADALPMNLGFLGKGNASRPEALVEQIRAGCLGLKLHEDWGTTPAAIDCCLSVAEAHDVQVAIHTDTLNESGFVEDTLAAFKGRAIHSYHTEGAGGGHAPDIIKACGEPQRAAVVDEPDPAVHGQHRRRAPGHADGLPPPRPRDRRGRRLRRVAHPARDDRGRGHPARPRRDQHDVERLAGDGTGGRGDHADLADRAQDEAAARGARARTPPAATTTSAPSATSPSTRSTRRSRTASPTRSARSRSASWRTLCCGSRRSSAPSRR